MEDRLNKFAPNAIAQVAHEANRALQAVLGEEVNPPYDHPSLPQEMRDSLIAGVEGILNGNTPADSHASWMERRLADGWKLGPTKNLKLKTSPNLVPYEELPIEQRVKDDLLIQITLAMTGNLPIDLTGYKVDEEVFDEASDEIQEFVGDPVPENWTGEPLPEMPDDVTIPDGVVEHEGALYPTTVEHVEAGPGVDNTTTNTASNTDNEEKQA